MAETTYTYNIASLPNGKANPQRLDSEISNSPNIYTELGYSSRISYIGGSDGGLGVRVGGTLLIMFKTQLTQAEKTTLDGGLSQLEENPPLTGSLLALHDSSPFIPDPDIQKVDVVYKNPSPRTGKTRAYSISIDWCKKETWYQDAVQATQKIYSGNGVMTQFQLDGASGAVSANERILDLNNGKVTMENFLFSEIPNDYLVKVMVGGVQKTERRAYEVSGGDYQVNYVTGVVTFFSAPISGTDNITVDYWYIPSGALGTFICSPPSGKAWLIDYAEVQFSRDVGINDSIMQDQWTNGVSALPLGPFEYRTLGSFLDVAVGSFPEIPAMGGALRGLSQPTQTFRWSYTASFWLRSSMLDQLRVWLKSGNAFSGERATVSFYAVEEDEESV